MPPQKVLEYGVLDCDMYPTRRFRVKLARSRLALTNDEQFGVTHAIHSGLYSSARGIRRLC